MFRRISVLVVIALLASCSPTKQVAVVAPEVLVERRAKNVIFLIGDGMGVAQITAAMYNYDLPLAIESFPVVGLHKNDASDELITDSAAGATAFSIGKKTYNGAIGIDEMGNPHKTLLEEAEEKGLATGLIATSTITHATPASFIAHVKSRQFQEDIAVDFLKTDIDLFIGGGMRFFSRRKNDERNLVVELQDKGYVVSDYFQRDFEEEEMNPTSPYAYFTADEAPLPASEGRDYLALATERALPFLKARSEKGFFIMVEGSQIDWGGHANNAPYVISEKLDFNQAIERALAFAKADGETLVIVTSDHETGGLAIQKGSERNNLITAFTSDYHTAELVPVFAYGPGSEYFSGIYDNTAIYEKIRAVFGW